MAASDGTWKRLDELLENGELRDLARRFDHERELCAELGLPWYAIRDWRRKHRGGSPTWRDLHGGETHHVTDLELGGNDADADEWAEEPTQPGAATFVAACACGHGLDVHRYCNENNNRTCVVDGCGCRGFRRTALKVPLDPIPAGFEVRDVGTQLDENGRTEKQWIGARRESIAFEEIRPAMPFGQILGGVSTLIDEQGGVRQQWIKTRLDQVAKLNMIAEGIKQLAEPFRGTAAPVASPLERDDDMLSVYPMGDPHIGMYAWSKETGQDFDTEIAERNLVGAVDYLVDNAPPARRALIVNLGDFFHADNSTNQTMRSHHALDVDTRWARVLGIGIRAMRRCIDKALAKHEHVRVVNEIGNHDDHSSIMLGLALAALYERESRVEIDTSPSPFHYYRFGRVLVGITHGHNVKAEKLGPVMATDRAEDWGETDHRYWLTGHVHHDSRKEFPGCSVETFATLAARDYWAHAGGYRSRQLMHRIDMHRLDGEIGRATIDIGRLMRRGSPT